MHRQSPRALPRGGSVRSAARAAHVERLCAPRLEDVVELADEALSRPRGRAVARRCAGRHRPRRARGRCPLRPDSPRRGAIVAGSAKQRSTPTARRSEERIRPWAPRVELGPKVELRVGADQPLGQRRRLDQEEPVVVAGREGPIGEGVHRRGRGDVEHGEPRHRAGWSSASRCATRPPRSCPARQKRSKPSRRITVTWSAAIARFA